MKIIVTGPESAFGELTAGSMNIEWIRTDSVEQFSTFNDANAFFNLHDDAGDESYNNISVPAFINCTITTLSKNEKLTRINGWNGFLKRSAWEITGNVNDKVIEILKALGKKAIPVADEPGFISARIISMIVNEAYFAKGEKVSSEKDIDIAMKLGTNYPKGPFEWAREIGLDKIYDLLKVLAIADPRYKPAPLLEKECKNS